MLHDFFSSFPVALWVFLLVVGLFIFLLPTLVALWVRHTQRVFIILLNLLLGWTAVGWIGAMVWAFIDPKQDGQQEFIVRRKKAAWRSVGIVATVLMVQVGAAIAIFFVVFPSAVNQASSADTDIVAAEQAPVVVAADAALEPVVAPAVVAPASAPALISRDPARNAAPLGLEVGYATLAGVRAELGRLTTLEDQGTNQYTNGTMLGSNGEGLNVDGLTSLTLIFDKNEVLAGVLMTLPKNVKETYSQLSKKYHKVENKIDNFMGYGYVRLEQGDTWVELDAQHLSFTMELRYLTKALMADFKQQSAADNAKKKQEQANKL